MFRAEPILLGGRCRVFPFSIPFRRIFSPFFVRFRYLSERVWFVVAIVSCRHRRSRTLFVALFPMPLPWIWSLLRWLRWRIYTESRSSPCVLSAILPAKVGITLRSIWTSGARLLRLPFLFSKEYSMQCRNKTIPIWRWKKFPVFS